MEPPTWTDRSGNLNARNEFQRAFRVYRKLIIVHPRIEISVKILAFRSIVVVYGEERERERERERLEIGLSFKNG